MSEEPLDHLTVGSGIPNATHSNVTVEPELYGVSVRLQSLSVIIKMIQRFQNVSCFIRPSNQNKNFKI